jgi:stage II sporulation protein D
LNFTETRSVADEYFTVDDIISGSRVTLNAHELLCEAVYSEIGSEWDEDAIKAQVVAAYSYLRFNDSIDRVPTVGLKQDYPEKIEKCVSAVEGQAVYYDNEIINAVYSASTAGYSIESERIWDVYYPYLRAVVSEFDNEDPNYGLEYEFTVDETRSILESTLGITLSDNTDNWFEMQDVYSGMYIGYVNIDGQTTVTGRNMEEMFGMQSQAFTVEISDGKVIFKSYGWGHGVGMSQWGACLYAKHGYTYDQILRHYYLNTTIGLSKESTKAVNRGKSYSTDSTTDSTDTSDTTDSKGSTAD